MCSIETVTATQTRDMRRESKDAWLWGIVCGWDEESMGELSGGRNWDADAKQRLQRLNERWDAIHLEVCAAARRDACNALVALLSAVEKLSQPGADMAAIMSREVGPAMKNARKAVGKAK